VQQEQRGLDSCIAAQITAISATGHPHPGMVASTPVDGSQLIVPGSGSMQVLDVGVATRCNKSTVVLQESNFLSMNISDSHWTSAQANPQPCNTLRPAASSCTFELVYVFKWISADVQQLAG
jgi:hypothetical protein